MRNYLLLFFLNLSYIAFAQQEKVNVFLGSSGDHGQLSPAASSPFHQLSIVPFTYPKTHTGYEYYAKEIIGFTHNRFEGVGCVGSGGLILIQPFLGDGTEVKNLHKSYDQAGPGYYELKTTEGITAQIAVHQDFGKEYYSFPEGEKGFYIDLGHSFNNAFVDTDFVREGNRIAGKVRAKTTCHAGTYSIYFAIEIPNAVSWKIDKNKIWVKLAAKDKQADINIAFSSVDLPYAVRRLANNTNKNYTQLKLEAASAWNEVLSAITVKGNKDMENMFYSLLYRVYQSPFQTSEADGKYRGTDGNIHQSSVRRYHGWAIWDNYKTQLPLLELLFPKAYQGITSSISDLYRFGKYDFAGPNEPANSVRTEHAAVVLLDAKRKGYDIHFDAIRDSLIRDTSRFDFAKPDKYLEAAYDMWAMSHLFESESAHYRDRAESYKTVWEREFKDLTKRDVDRMSARSMYQGTIRQYRWNVPFDAKGLIELAGGKKAFTDQLDDFFDNYYFNRANEPDMQSQTMYYASETPWRYQEWVHRIALDTVIQFYFNDNSRGIDSHIDRIYKNEPKAFIRTMDDDAGAMTAWWVLSSIGLHQPLIGEPVYYINVPFFEEVRIKNQNKPLVIKVKNAAAKNRYIRSIHWNGKDLGRLWITREELAKGGELTIETSPAPTNYGVGNIWVSSLDRVDK